MRNRAVVDDGKRCTGGCRQRFGHDRELGQRHVDSSGGNSAASTAGNEDSFVLVDRSARQTDREDGGGEGEQGNEDGTEREGLGVEARTFVPAGARSDDCGRADRRC